MATKPGSDDDRPVLDDDIRQIVSDARPWEKKEPDDDRDVLREYDGGERVFADVNVPQRIEAGGPQHNGEYTITDGGKPPADEEHGAHRERPEEEQREYEPAVDYGEPAAEEPPHTEDDGVVATGDGPVASNDDDPDASAGDGGGAVDDSEVATGEGPVASNDDDPDASVGDGGGAVDDSASDSTDGSSDAPASGADRDDDGDPATKGEDGSDSDVSDEIDASATSFGSGSDAGADDGSAAAGSSGGFGSGAGDGATSAPATASTDAGLALDDVKEPDVKSDAFDEIEAPTFMDEKGDFEIDLDEKEFELDEVDDIELID